MSQALQDVASAKVLSRGRVLVVDDEPAVARMLRRALTTAGYEVATADNGEKAIGLLADPTFDAIVSDIDMPRMSGIQLLQAVRHRHLDVPVILITGAPAMETAVQAISLGALLYLTKPVELVDLERAVARAVRLNRMATLKQEALSLVSDGGTGAAE